MTYMYGIAITYAVASLLLLGGLTVGKQHRQGGEEMNTTYSP